MLTARLGVTDRHASFHRSWVRNLDQAQAEFDYAFYAFDHIGHLAGLLVKDDYGLYKILFIGSLIWLPFPGRNNRGKFGAKANSAIFAVTLGTIIFFGGALALRMEQQEKIPFRQVIPMKLYSDLAGLRHRVGSRPVLLVCDYIFDRESAWFDQDWAFFLRRVNLGILKYIGLYPEVGPSMRQAKSFIEPAAFVLVNGPIEGAIWKNERFSLFELTDQAKLIGVGTTVSLAAFAKLDWFQAPNDLELPNGKPFVWLGNNATRFLIVSKQGADRKFFCVGISSRPGLPQDRDRHLRISIGICFPGCRNGNSLH